MRGPLGRQEFSATRRPSWRYTILIASLCCSPAAKGSSLTEQSLLAGELPACYVLGFDVLDRPETDLGAFPDTITLTRPFWSAEEISGYVYGGLFADSVLPRSPAAAKLFGQGAVCYWTSSRDSLILSTPGTFRALSIYLGTSLNGVWREKSRSRIRTGEVTARRIPCPR